MYTVRGMWRRQPHSVTWDNGRLSGHDGLVVAIESEAATLEGFAVGPTAGPLTFTDHLQDPVSALVVMRTVFDSIREVSGDVPDLPPTPRGAII